MYTFEKTGVLQHVSPQKRTFTSTRLRKLVL